METLKLEYQASLGGRLVSRRGSRDYKVYILEHNGTLKASYATGNYATELGCVSIDDVDGDGKVELCAGSLDYYMYCLIPG
jgi:hypothetical protein